MTLTYTKPHVTYKFTQHMGLYVLQHLQPFTPF